MFGWFKRFASDEYVLDAPTRPSGKKSIPESHEFITNPPAKELALKNKEELEARRKLAVIERKNRRHADYLSDIEKLEMQIDNQIKNAIKDGDDYCYVKNSYNYGSYNDEYTLKKTYKRHKYSATTMNYIAARRFRARGFKVSIKTTEGQFISAYWQPTDQPQVTYTKNIIISWE